MVCQRGSALFGFLTLLLSVALSACPAVDAAAPLAKVTRIDLAENAGELQLRVTASGPIRFELIDVRSDWVVVDLKPAQLGFPAGTLPYSRDPIRRIRVGQFSQDTVRVVVELTHAIRVRLAASPDRLAVVVGIPVAGKGLAQPAQSQAAPSPSSQPARSQAPSSSSKPAVAPVQPPAGPAQPMVIPVQAAAQPSAGGYVLGTDDVLEVRVWGYPDLTGVAGVRPDGRIAVPLAGTLPASGLSVGQLQQDLTRAYAEYIINPQVTVIVKEFRKIRVSVLGQVAHPGTYPLTPGARLLDALSAAGGVTDLADLQEARVLQHGISRRVVNLQRALAGDPEANIALRGGETVVVSEDLANVVSVAGEVAHPGRFRLKGEMRVLDALLMAGGLTERASVSQARLTRASGERPVFDLGRLMLHQDMNQNIALQPGDTLIVPEDVDNKFYVVGDVGRPGVYPLKGKITVLEAIAMAGGPTQRGIGTAKTAQIVRRNEQSTDITANTQAQSIQRLGDRGVVMTLDLRAVMHGDLSKNEPLRPGDVVVVPETGVSSLPLILQVIGTILFGIRP